MATAAIAAGHFTELERPAVYEALHCALAELLSAKGRNDLVATLVSHVELPPDKIGAVLYQLADELAVLQVDEDDEEAEAA